MKLKALSTNGVFVLMMACSSLANADIAVIVNPSFAGELSEDKTAQIFLGQLQQFPNGNTAIPVDQKPGSQARNEFHAKVTQKSESKLEAYWAARTFTGKGQPPKELNTDQDVIRHVADNPNVIGYVNAVSIDQSVRVLFVK